MYRKSKGQSDMVKKLWDAISKIQNVGNSIGQTVQFLQQKTAGKREKGRENLQVILFYFTFEMEFCSFHPGWSAMA